MAAKPPPRLPASSRSEPAKRAENVIRCLFVFNPLEQRQKVEEYRSRKKTFSGVLIEENQGSISSRTRRATSSKLQGKTQLSASPKPGMENKENTNELSWDQSNGASEKNVTLNSSTSTLTNSISGAKYNSEDHASKNEVTEIKSQHVSLSKSFLQMKSMKEKELIAETKQNSSVSLPKKQVFGTYRGKIIPSKINSFRKVPKHEGKDSSLPDKKILPSATRPTASSLSMNSCSIVVKTVKVTKYHNSVKPNGTFPFQNKQSDKAAISSLKKWQLTPAVVSKKVTVQKMISERGPQLPKAASNNFDRRALGVKRCADFCEDARPEAPAKAVSLVPGTKLGQDSKTKAKSKSTLPKETAEERRARLAEWRASRGKVMRRPPTCVLLKPKSKREEQELSSGNSLEHVLHSEKVKKTLAECLHLIEQGCQGDEVRAMLEDLTQSTPGAKKLANYWICCMRLEQMGPLEKLIAIYEEAILAGAVPRVELRHALIDTMKNTESLFKFEDGKREHSDLVKCLACQATQGGSMTEAHLSEVVEVSKEPNSSVEQVQEAFKDFDSDDQKAEGDDKKAETSSEEIKEEVVHSDLKPREEILPKSNKKHKTKERTKKKGKWETQEQNEDGEKDIVQVVNSPEKENDTSYSMTCNPSTTPYLERMYHEANDSGTKDLKVVTPLRYSQRIREKMCKVLDTVQDEDAYVSI
ncbi:Ckap2 [Columba guinea]|nr:Ckap2 [Columba guinea]